MSLQTAKYAAVARGYTQVFRQEVRTQTPFFPQISTVVNSGSNEEAYVGLGAVPGMREFLGDRNFEQLRAADFTIKNRDWEQSVGLDKNDIDDDRYGIYSNVIRDMARKASRHPDQLIGELIRNGETNPCFDGQNFFDTDHEWGTSGTQSNDLTFAAASGTSPTPDEWRQSFSQAYEAMLGFKDDQGDFVVQPVADGMNELVALVPVSMWDVANKAINESLTSDGTVAKSNVMLTRPRLVPYQWIGAGVSGGSNDKWYLFYTGGTLRPLVYQSRMPLMTEIKGTESIEDKLVKFMTKARYNCGYGLWAHAVLTTFT